MSASPVRRRRYDSDEDEGTIHSTAPPMVVSSAIDHNPSTHSSLTSTTNTVVPSEENENTRKHKHHHKRQHHRSRSRSRSPRHKHHHRSRSRSRSPRHKHHHHKHNEKNEYHSTKHAHSHRRHHSPPSERMSSTTSSIPLSYSVLSLHPTSQQQPHQPLQQSIHAPSLHGSHSSTSTTTEHQQPSSYHVSMGKVLSPSRQSTIFDDPRDQSYVPPIIPSMNPNTSSSPPSPPPPLIEKANFGLSGILAKTTNTVSLSSIPPNNSKPNTTVKYIEPSDARITDKRWKLFIFKGNEEIMEPIKLSHRSKYLFGRDHTLVDIPIDHPSCSKQHAVIQFRLVPIPNEPGDMNPPQRVIKPYLIDLETTNGTKLNNQRIESARYIELRSQDVLKFGDSSRDYVLMEDK